MDSKINMSLDEVIELNKRRETAKNSGKKYEAPVKGKLKGNDIIIRNRSKELRKDRGHVGSGRTVMNSNFGWYDRAERRRPTGIFHASKRNNNGATNDLSRNTRKYIQQAVAKAVRVSRGDDVAPRRGVNRRAPGQRAMRMDAFEQHQDENQLDRRFKSVLLEYDSEDDHMIQNDEDDDSQGFAEEVIREVVRPARQKRRQVIVKEIVRQPVRQRVIVTERPQRQMKVVKQVVRRQQPVKIVRQFMEEQPVRHQNVNRMVVVERPVLRERKPKVVECVLQQPVRQQNLQRISRVEAQRVQVPQRTQRMQFSQRIQRMPFPQRTRIMQMQRAQAERRASASHFRNARIAKNERMMLALDIGHKRKKQSARFEPSSLFLKRNVSVRKGRGFNDDF